MVRNTEKYETAISLRKRGFTLDEIAKYCDVAKSTASNWLKNKDFSAQVTKQNQRRASTENAKRLQLISKARRSERKSRYQEALRSAETEYKHYKKDPLFLAGVMAYAAAGDLSERPTLRLTSSQFAVQRLFVRFVQEYLGVDKAKIRFWLLLPAERTEAACMRKWKRALNIPYKQWSKNQFARPSLRQGQTLHFGVGNTIIGSTVSKQKLKRWIELAEVEL